MKTVIPARKRSKTLTLGNAMMDNVMVDLETLGRRPGCAILSIGAVAFCPEQGLGREFYIIVDRSSQLNLGLHEDGSTLKWWESQSEDAREVLRVSGSGAATHLRGALKQFTEFLSQFGFRRVKIWGNGSDFDNAILSCAYGALQQDVPWDFWNNRCYRTLKNLKPGPKLKREGTYHNALDDAKSQALHAIELLR